MLEGGRVRYALPFATAAVVVLVGVMSYRAVSLVQTASSWVEHTREVSSELLELQTDLLLLSRAHHTYVVLGDPSALALYQQTRGALAPRQARLRALVQDHPVNRANLLALERLIAPMVESLDHDLRPHDLAAFARTDGELDRVGALLHLMASEEDALLARRRISQQRSLTAAQYVIGGGATLALVLGLLSNLSMGRLASRREATELQRERLIGQLERRNRELDQFAYATSHDLKAPLRGVVNVAQWLEEDLGSALGPEGRRMLHLMRGRIQRMEALIEGILRFSRVGRDAVPSEAVDTGALLREVVELATPPADAAIQLPSSAPIILTQRVLLQQVLLNLVSNAFKHAGKANPHLGIEVHDLGEALEFVLHDDGPGIDPAYHQRIFRMFQTLESRDKVEGAGIGLAVVQKIVDTVGGKIGLESAVGRGATFRLAWPKRPGALGVEWNA
ncbi:MAG: CHASE3 domain-containing protein [Deltaproteobacteria bacterium]|nr:CHASE3 domain-containing protein [Deltaproteobacteria bacterium]